MIIILSIAIIVILIALIIIAIYLIETRKELTMVHTNVSKINWDIFIIKNVDKETGFPYIKEE